MKYILLIALAFGGFLFYSNFESKNNLSASATSVIKIYGANSCKYTVNTLDFLDSADINYQYLNVKNNEHLTEMIAKMESHGMDTTRLEIPLLEIGGKLFIDPAEEVISREYKKLL